MRKEIEMTMEDGSKKLLPFEANGATAIRYRMVFHEDLMLTMNSLSGENVDTLIGAKLGYIMNAQAEKRTQDLSMDDFITWAAAFDGMSLVESLEAFVSLYLGNRYSTSEGNAQPGRPTGK